MWIIDEYDGAVGGEEWVGVGGVEYEYSVAGVMEEGVSLERGRNVLVLVVGIVEDEIGVSADEFEIGLIGVVFVLQSVGEMADIVLENDFGVWGREGESGGVFLNYEYEKLHGLYVGILPEEQFANGNAFVAIDELVQLIDYCSEASHHFAHHLHRLFR